MLHPEKKDKRNWILILYIKLTSVLTSDSIYIIYNSIISRLSAISAYSPTECNSTDKQKAEFYKLVNQTISKCPNRFPIFVCGDFNARIGNPDSGYIGPWYIFNREFNSLIDCKTFGSLTDISDHISQSQKEDSVQLPSRQRVSFIAQIIYST